MIKKNFDVSAISSGGWDEIVFLAGMPSDGRTTVVARQPLRPSGTAANGLSALSFMPGRLAIGSIVGGDEAGASFKRTVERIGISSCGVVSIAGKTTNHRLVLQSNGRRLIAKDDGVSFEDLQRRHIRRFKSLAAQSKGLLVGNIPLDITIELARWCRRVQTMFALVPGHHQIHWLDQIPVDLVALNRDESRIATRMCSRKDDTDVFELLTQTSNASKIIQTGGGSHDSLLYDRESASFWSVPPPDLSPFAAEKLDACGCGDIATSVTFRGILEGIRLPLAFAKWGRAVVTAHLLGRHFDSVGDLDAWVCENRRAFVPPSALQLDAA